MRIPCGHLILSAAIAAVGLTSSSPAIDRAVDTRVALKIGNYGVSHYLVQKFYQRFHDDVFRRTGRPPSLVDSQKWLDRFVDQHSVIALAEREGFGSRESVAENVARMEHHMLTQQSGPFYDHIVGTGAPSDAELERRYQDSMRRRDVVVAKFESIERMHAVLGAHPETLPNAEILA